MSNINILSESLLSSSKYDTLRFYLGILFTGVIAAMGTGLSYLPAANKIGAMLCAILIAVLYRNTLGYPESLRSGIQFTGQKILRFAIILYGFRLNINMVLRQGLPLLLQGALTIVLAISITLIISKYLKGDKELSLLLGLGTGICGAAAIATVAPILNAQDEDTAIGVGIIALVGTIFTLAYTILYPYLGLTQVQYGMWSGLTLHEIAHAVAAAVPAGSDALEEALLAKLGRVFLLIPVSLILVLWMRHNSKENSETAQKPSFPWFLLGFMLTSLIGTYLSIPTRVLDSIATLSSFLLATAMVGLGLNVHIGSLRSRALRPLAAMLAASITISIVTYLTIVL